MPRKSTRVPSKLKVPRSQKTILKRETRPTFSPWTIATVLLLAGMIGLAVFFNQRKEKQATEAEPTSAISYVFTSEDGLPASIEVADAAGTSVRLVRNEEAAWALELPELAEADQGKAEAAASQVSSLRVLNDKVNLSPADIGLDEPAYIITLEFTGGSEHVLEVGDATPTNSGYYVRVDKEKTLIVALAGIDGLTTLVSFPPYLNTPTPTAVPPTSTPIPPTSTTTPEPAVTPTP
jgi:hypothetical protein